MAESEEPVHLMSLSPPPHWKYHRATLTVHAVTVSKNDERHSHHTTRKTPSLPRPVHRSALLPPVKKNKKKHWQPTPTPAPIEPFTHPDSRPTSEEIRFWLDLDLRTQYENQLRRSQEMQSYAIAKEPGKSSDGSVEKKPAVGLGQLLRKILCCVGLRWIMGICLGSDTGTGTGSGSGNKVRGAHGLGKPKPEEQRSPIAKPEPHLDELDLPPYDIE